MGPGAWETIRTFLCNSVRSWAVSTVFTLAVNACVWGIFPLFFPLVFFLPGKTIKRLMENKDPNS